MPKYRNASDDTLEVEPTPGARQIVKPDEVIDVSDSDERVWPETVWTAVTGGGKQTGSKKDEETV